MRLRKLSSIDPFDHFPYPSGATGLVVRFIGYEHAIDNQGNYYVLRRVIQSKDYVDNWGEHRTGTTSPFIDTYWRVATKAEARMLTLHLLTGRDHYKNCYSLLHK